MKRLVKHVPVARFVRAWRGRSAGLWACLALAGSGAAASRPAAAEEVGLGLALGGAYSPTELQAGHLRREAGGGMAGGFFVDIPLAPKLMLTPSATLWALDLGQGREPATDFDLAGKLLLPVGPFRLGGGMGLGISHLERHIWPHLAAQALVALEVGSGVEAFAGLTYKHIVRRAQTIDAVHGLAGLVWQI